MIDPVPPDTVRSRIMRHLLDRFTTCRAGVDGRHITWGAVSDTPFSEKEAQFAPERIALIDVRERKRPEVGYSRCELTVNAEFHATLAKGDKPNEIANQVLGEVQAVMLSDIYCGGLTLDIVEVGNELEVEGSNDTSVSGIVFWEILYRHKAGDPRKLVGE